MHVTAEQRNAVGDPIARASCGCDQLAGGCLTPTPGDRSNRRILGVDPKLIEPRQIAHRVSEWIGTGFGKRRQRLHTEFYALNRLIWLDPLHLSCWQEIGVSGAQNTVLVEHPAG